MRESVWVGGWVAVCFIILPFFLFAGERWGDTDRQTLLSTTMSPMQQIHYVGLVGWLIEVDGLYNERTNKQTNERSLISGVFIYMSLLKLFIIILRERRHDTNHTERHGRRRQARKGRQTEGYRFGFVNRPAGLWFSGSGYLFIS